MVGPQYLKKFHANKIDQMQLTQSVVNSINQFLESLPTDHKIKKLQVQVDLRFINHASHFDHWIAFAIKRVVEELDLCLYNAYNLHC